MSSVLWAVVWAATCYFSFFCGVSMTCQAFAKVSKTTVGISLPVHVLFVLFCFVGAMILLKVL
ncbi:hypothetical protein HYV71_03455 [Candidatus Uhrbacteria bacterium]|nr:hypothetical protein [Candidatus Uhrbacteria bacterium]